MGFCSRHSSRLHPCLTSHHSAKSDVSANLHLAPRSPPGCLTAQPHLHLQRTKSPAQISTDSSSEDPLPPKQRPPSPPHVGDRQQTYGRESFSLRHSSVTHLEPAVAWEDSDTRRVTRYPVLFPTVLSHSHLSSLPKLF